MVLQDEVVIEGVNLPALQLGKIYVMFGCISPVWRHLAWHFQAPRLGPHSGIAWVVAWDRPLSSSTEANVSTGSEDASMVEQRLRDNDAAHDMSSHRQHDGGVCGDSHTHITGFVDLQGKFHSMPAPCLGQTWPQWIAPECPVPCQAMQATIDGIVVPHTDSLPLGGFILRLRGLLRGGANKDRTKLVQHLLARGVPQSAVEQRADDVIACIGQEGLQEVYKSLEPWAKLKQLINNRMRLVSPTELKMSKQKPRSLEDDPWLKSDPWSEAVSSGDKRKQDDGPLDIELIPGTFIDISHAPVPIISALRTGGHGVTFSSLQEVEAFASLGGSSDDGLASVVLSPIRPKVPSDRVSEVTFPASASNQRILLRGWLVQFGNTKIGVSQAKHQITAEDNQVAIISCELRKEYIDDWSVVVNNPMRYIHNHIDNLQGVISSWSKRWYSGNKQVQAKEASTWHAFMKLPRDALSKVLPQSGKDGIFFTPKDGPSTSSSGEYRVVWTHTADIVHAMTVMRAYPSAQGLVRGRNSLGIRVTAKEYSSIRQKLEPSWTASGIKTDIPIMAKWSIAPIPPSMDKLSLQKILDQMSWEATPLRQVNHNTWLIGSSSSDAPPTDTVEVNGNLVLITPAQPSKANPPSETLVAGPVALRKAINRQMALGSAAVVPYIGNPQDAVVPQGPTMTQVGVLQADMDRKLEDMNQRFQTAIADLQQQQVDIGVNMKHHQQQVHQAQHECAQRVVAVEQKVECLSAAVVTKADLTQALKEAMDLQRSELRLLLSKRSPDVTPTNTGDGKSQRVG